MPVVVLQIRKNRKQTMYTSNEIKKVLSLKIPCNVVSIETGRKDSLFVISSKHNPFIGIIKFHLQTFFNNGIMNRLIYATFKKNFQSMMQHQPVQIVIDIMLILFILIGIILSTFILIIEKYIFVRKSKKC
ncbi:uncharacterized protein LOC124949119 [Vespa velutina]|uniref:uncharacterized protein LOC124949119 n=1 Tax=Vespa velutina TaxID=202808 RepID=UPI001FB450DE|nr:uncharacterized protein LOC124949119 [Vespa velutina]